MRLIVNGQRYTNQGFNWNALTPDSPTDLSGHSGTTTISRKSFTNLNTGVLNGGAIYLSGSGTVTVENSYFGPTAYRAIEAENFTGTLLVKNCLFVSNMAGVYAAVCSGNIQVEYCQFLNPWGARDCRGQAVQFNQVTGNQSYVRYCRGESFRGEGYTEDWISFYETSGTAGNHITAGYNKLRGGGPSGSGGGILCGEAGGSYCKIEFNELVNPGNYGVSINMGDNNILDSNRIYSDYHDYNNAGIIIGLGSPCTNGTVTNNHVTFPYWEGGYQNVYGNGNCDSGVFSSNGNVEMEDLATMMPDFPTRLIDYVTEDVLWQLRDESIQFQDTGVGGACDNEDTPVQYPRPEPVTEADKSTSSTSTTINSTGSSGGTIYNWVQVSGPNIATLANENTATLSVSNMVDGVYNFRLEYSDADGASAASWTQVTKTP